MQDTLKIKEKILSILKEKGPSLPVHIASEIKTSVLFTSAFLSELISERKVKISYMKIGNSPLYFLPGQEPLLEKYADYLKKKEKDAFLLLKEKKILKDSEQEPSIRVALRAIKDFAIPIKKDNELFWKYFKEQEKELPVNLTKEKLTETKEDKKIEPIFVKEEKQQIFSQVQEKKKKELKTKKEIKKRNYPKSTKRSNDKFFDKVKKYLSSKGIEISDIESFNKNELFLIIKKNSEKTLLAAFNKKRITENDLIKSNKKARELNLKYAILCLGEPLKKLQNTIEAIKNLSEIEKIQ